MRLWRFLLLALLPLAGGCAGVVAPPGRGPLPPLVERVRQAVVMVVTYDAEGQPSGVGSGFFTSSSGELITNYHVLSGAYSAEVRTPAGETHPVERVTAADRSRDLIRVSVSMEHPPPVVLPISGRLPRIAQPVVVIGSPLGLEQTVTEGIVSAMRDVPGVGTVFQMSAPISPGSSGGPVVDLSGTVVGVVSFQAAVGQNLNFAVPGQELLRLPPLSEPLELARWTLKNSSEKSRAAEELCRQGFTFIIDGQYREALGYYLQAAETAPEDSDAWYGLGSCYLGMERTEEALEAFRRPVQNDPDSPDAWLDLGNHYHRMALPREAVAAYRRSLDIDPDNPTAWFALGMASGALEDSDGQIDAFRQVLRLEPEFGPAHFSLGLALGRAGKFDAAATHLEQAVRRSPDNAPAWHYLGQTYIELGRDTAATEALHRAIRNDPDFAPPHYALGLLAAGRNNRAGALAEYKVLLVLDADLAARLFHVIYPPPDTAIPAEPSPDEVKLD